MFTGRYRVLMGGAIAGSGLLCLLLVAGLLMFPGVVGRPVPLAQEAAANGATSVPSNEAASRGQRPSGIPAPPTISPTAENAGIEILWPQLTPETTPASPPQQSQQPAAGPPSDAGSEVQVLALVNEARSAAGCGLLTADDALAGLARAHSADMRDRGFFAHTNPSGQGPADRAAAAGIVNYAAENIAYGFPTAEAVMQSWMNSPGHRTNILDCSLRTLGVGVAYGGAAGPYWTQNFGR